MLITSVKWVFITPITESLYQMSFHIVAFSNAMVPIFIPIFFFSSMLSNAEKIATEVKIETSPDLTKTNNKRPVGGESIHRRLSRATASSYYKWSSSDEMKSYTLEQFNRYIVDTDLDDNILTGSCPSKFSCCNSFGRLFEEPLAENQKFYQIPQDKSYQKIHQKIVNVIIP